jgi:hypothetical protein
MTLLDQYIAVEKNRRAQPWFERLLCDAAYLHATCLMVSAYYDAAYARSRSCTEQQTAFIVYSKAVRKLRERLARDDEEATLSDTTVMTVMHLASHAQVTGEYGTARHHLTGLLKIVTLRGIACFLNNPLLLILILRYAHLYPGAKRTLTQKHIQMRPGVGNPSKFEAYLLHTKQHSLEVGVNSETYLNTRQNNNHERIPD